MEKFFFCHKPEGAGADSTKDWWIEEADVYRCHDQGAFKRNVRAPQDLHASHQPEEALSHQPADEGVPKSPAVLHWLGLWRGDEREARKIPEVSWVIMWVTMIAAVCIFLSALPVQRQVVLTIDDLPFVGADRSYAAAEENTRLLLKSIRDERISAIGFVVGEGFAKFTNNQRKALYRRWIKAGCELGNHTWTHADLDKTGLKGYTDEILETHSAMVADLGERKVDYFRAPYLNNGATKESKSGLQEFLKSHHFVEAPVTIDTDDWKISAAFDKAYDAKDKSLMRRLQDAYVPYMEARTQFFEEQTMALFNRPIPQIILTHANRINARQMPALIEMFRRRGYQFISLTEALRDRAYLTPDTYVGSDGLSWIYRWQLGKGQTLKPGPQLPSWIGQ